MFQELKPSEYEKVRSLFQGFDYSLSIQAAFEGNNPGRIFVDNLEAPRTAVALTVEGTLLTGDHSDPATITDLNQLFEDQIFTGQVFVEEDWSMTLAVHPEEWEAKLSEIIPTHQAFLLTHYYYLCRKVRFNWRRHMPRGYTLHRIDQDLLSDPALAIPEDLSERIQRAWGTADNFVTNGAGFCVLHENAVVSRCTADCVAGERIDVGFLTAPVHQRRGLATAVIAATAEYCLSQGFTAVGVHCEAGNLASWKAVGKVGFEKAREYVYYYYIFDQVDHLAQLGWSHFKSGEYQRTVEYFEQAFAAREDHPDYSYYCAAEAYGALENREMALKYLNLAADRGWGALDYTSRTEWFRFLHGTPEWEAVLARMGKNVQ
jgi:RimJ/RimL family protein N-acetyltransferase